MSLDQETNIKIIAESLDILGLNVMASLVRASYGNGLKGYAEIAKAEAEKRNESFIVEKMEMIIRGDNHAS